MAQHSIRQRWHGAAALLAALLWLAAPAAGADEIRVLSAGAAKAALTELAKSFHAETGHVVKLDFATVGRLQERLMGGEAADLVIVTRETLDALQAAERTVPGARRDLGTVQVGVGVREGAAKPDLSSPEAFKRTLLAARAVAAVDPAKGGTSGIHFAAVLERLGIAEQMRDKLRLVPGGYVAELVARGEADLAVQQITELRAVPGVAFAGPLPAELQKTTTYSGAIVMHTPVAEAAASFLRYLAGAAGRQRFVATGFGLPD